MEAGAADYRAEPVNFSNPPVAEVALSLQFSESVTDDARTVGNFWPEVREQLPKLQQHPALPQMREDFGPPQPAQFEFSTGTPPSRFWFLSEDESHLVQVQADRFTLNWRRMRADADYPRYRQLREQYEQMLARFVAAVRPETTVAPDWCEVTYVNHILAPDARSTPPPLTEVLTLVREPEPNSVLPEAEDVHFAERFRLRTGEEPVGRLHINASPGIRTLDQLPLQQLTLVARGRAARADVGGGLAFLDRGRSLIVQAFREVTTPQMHSMWGLQE